MNKRVFHASLSIFTTLALISCSQVISTNSPIVQQIPEPINTDTTLKIDSIIPKMFNTKAKKLEAGDEIPGRFIVKFKNNEKTTTDNENLLKLAKSKKLGDIKKSMRIFLIEADNVLNNKVLESLKNNPDVEYIEQDKIRTIEDPSSEQPQFAANVIPAKKINLQNSTSAQSVNIAADTRQLVSFSVLYNGSTIYNAQARVGDVFNFNGINYLVQSNCLEGPSLPNGYTFSLPLCANSHALTPINITFYSGGNPVGGVSTYVGAAFYISDGSNDYWYTARSNCLEGPALPPGLTASLPLCGPAPTPTPVPTPTPTATPVPTPTPTPVITPTPVPFQTGRPSYLQPPSATPTPLTSGRPGFLQPPAPTPTPTALPTGRPGFLQPPSGPTTTPTPLVSARPGFLPGTPAFTANDPLRNNQYIINQVKLLEGLTISPGSNNVTVAVIDTGVEGTHEDLTDKIVGGFTAFNGASATVDPHGHGTHCAGVAAASTNNGIGIVGMAPNAKIMPVQVLDASGAGSDSAVAAGIMYAADSSAKVLSMSLGGPGGSQTLNNAIAYAISKGKVVVAAMGNSGNSVVSYPAGYAGVIAVGATDNTDQRAVFSQYGPHIAVTAPGVNIYSTFRGNAYQYMNGTSMACPAVAGLAALVLGYKPNLTAAQVKTSIQNGADDLGTPGFDNYFGYGRINVQKTLSAL